MPSSPEPEWSILTLGLGAQVAEEVDHCGDVIALVRQLGWEQAPVAEGQRGTGISARRGGTEQWTQPGARRDRCIIAVTVLPAVKVEGTYT